MVDVCVVMNNGEIVLENGYFYVFSGGLELYVVVLDYGVIVGNMLVCLYGVGFMIVGDVVFDDILGF